MMIVVNWDFFGTEEELKEMDKRCQKMADESEGLKFIGRFTPTGLKWHFSYFFKAETEKAWVKRKRMTWTRDRKVWTHGVVWQFV